MLGCSQFLPIMGIKSGSCLPSVWLYYPASHMSCWATGRLPYHRHTAREGGSTGPTAAKYLLSGRWALRRAAVADWGLASVLLSQTGSAVRPRHWPQGSLCGFCFISPADHCFHSLVSASQAFPWSPGRMARTGEAHGEGGLVCRVCSGSLTIYTGS